MGYISRTEVDKNLLEERRAKSFQILNFKGVNFLVDFMSTSPPKEWQSKSISELFSFQTAKMVETANKLEQALLFLLDGDFQNIQAPVTAISRLEKECNRMKEIFSKKLVETRTSLPITRADLLKVVQKVDGVVNQGDLIARRLLLHELKVPPALVPQMKDLVCHSTESVRHLRDAVNDLNQDLKKAITGATLAEDDRREARNICWALLKDLYHASNPMLTLILTRELVLGVRGLADVVEICSDFIVTLAITYSNIS